MDLVEISEAEVVAKATTWAIWRQMVERGTSPVEDELLAAVTLLESRRELAVPSLLLWLLIEWWEMKGD